MRATPTASRPERPACTCPRCDNPTHNDHTVCVSCVAGLRRDLRDLLPRAATRTGHTGRVEGPRHQRTPIVGPRDVLEPGLLDELELTLTRQDVFGRDAIPEPPEEARTKDGPPAATVVLVFRPAASEVGRYLHASLDHWAHHLMDTLDITEADAFPDQWRPAIPAQRTVGELAPQRWVQRMPTQRTRELAAWLDRHPDGIATNADAGALVEDIRGAIESVRRLVFPHLSQYAGPCECGEQLYAAQHAAAVRCRECGRRWPVDERVKFLRAQAEGMFLSAEDMSRALPRLAADISIPPLTASQIRSHGHRGRLVEHRPDPLTWSVDPDGQPVPPPPRYKVGEVIAFMYVLLQEEQDRQERRARAQSATTKRSIAAAHERFREKLRA